MNEFEPFGEGTRFLAAELAHRIWPSLHTSVICGSSLVRSLRRMGIPTERVRHLTPAGHATLHYFAGRSLPAVDVLNSADKTAHKPLRILIPLDGSDADASALNVMAQMATPDMEILLLHVRSGPDEELYPDLIAALSEAEKFERRIESERIFARANSILASHGFISADQAAAQGEPAQIILRRASQLEAGLIVVAAGVARETIGIRRVTERATCEVLVAPSTVAVRVARTPHV
jgi:universal stress protein family protein